MLYQLSYAHHRRNACILRHARWDFNSAQTEWARQVGRRKFDESLCFGSPLLADTVLIYPALKGDGVFFDGKNQFLSEIHLPSGFDADAHVGEGFSDDAARQRDVALTNCNEQNHRLTEPGRIRG
jgi:hypothetical protein